MKQKLLNSFKLRAVMLVAILCAGFTSTWADTKTDVLNQALTGITGSSYTEWSGKTSESGAVYAGQSAGSNSSIQLRSNSSNSGVVTTTSGGKVKSITVVWNSNTSSGRTLNVYGKNSAYSAATDLYNTSNQGTLLGTIVCGTSTSLTISDDYEYIGFRSASGAMYLTSVSIVWETGGGSGSSAVTTTTTIISSGITNTDVYAGTAAGSLTATVTASGNAVAGATVTWSSSDEDVATISSNGTVTLVGKGTVTFTASYAGVSGEYLESSATYEMNVVDTTPFEGGDVTFTAGTDVGTTSANGSSDEVSKNGVTISSTDAAFATDQYRLYKDSETTISTQSGKITKIVFTNADSKNPCSNLSIASGSTGNYSNNTWTGSATSVKFSASAQARASQIVVTVISDDAVADPEISGTENFYNETQVTITCSTEGATIKYSTDNTDWITYEGDITINATSTIYAKAEKDNKTSSVVSKTFTKVTPMTVAEAREAIDAGSGTQGVYVQGIVSAIVTEYNSQYHNISYNISADGTTTSDQLEVFRGKGMNNSNFTSADDITVGDVVVIYGNLIKYNNTTYEFSEGNYLINQIRKADPELSFSPSTAQATIGETFTAPTLVNTHNLAVTYSIVGSSDVATINASTGAVTIGSVAGSVTVKATFDGDATYRAGSASYTLTVQEPNYIELAAGASVSVTSFPSFSGTGYKTVNNYKIVTGDITKDWSVNEGMKSGDGLQLKASSGSLVSPEIRARYGYTVSVTYTSEQPMTLTSGETSSTGENGSVSLTVTSTAASFTLNAGSKFAVVSGITITATAAPTTESVTVGAAGYTTFVPQNNVSFPTGVSGYIVTNVGATSIHLEEMLAVPAGTPVVVKATQGSYDLEVVGNDDCDVVTANLLHASNGNVTGDGTTIWALAMFNNKVGFNVVDDGVTIPAGKAYLVIPAEIKGFLTFDFDSEDAIKGVEAISENGVIFNLAGQRVNKAQKGIYIVNGKKVLVK